MALALKTSVLQLTSVQATCCKDTDGQTIIGLAEREKTCSMPWRHGKPKGTARDKKKGVVEAIPLFRIQSVCYIFESVPIKRCVEI